MGEYEKTDYKKDGIEEIYITEMEMINVNKNEFSVKSEVMYSHIRETVISAQNKVVASVNTAMVQAYWEIGEQIHIACNGNDRAEYGKNLLKYLSEELSKEFGKGYTVANLKNMRQFYRIFPNRYTLCSELSWSHYRLLMRIDNEERRNFCLN